MLWCLRASIPVYPIYFVFLHLRVCKNMGNRNDEGHKLVGAEDKRQKKMARRSGKLMKSLFWSEEETNFKPSTPSSSSTGGNTGMRTLSLRLYILRKKMETRVFRLPHFWSACKRVKSDNSQLSDFYGHVNWKLQIPIKTRSMLIKTPGPFRV